MITIRSAVVDDAEAISALLMANGVEQGGALYGEWSIGAVTGWIKSGALIVVATQGSRLIGVLFTSEKAQASAPPILAMLKAWAGRDDAYIYGTVCVDRHARGTGVLEALHGEVVTRLPGREAILFVNGLNDCSLRAHIKLGFKDVNSSALRNKNTSSSVRLAEMPARPASCMSRQRVGFHPARVPDGRCDPRQSRATETARAPSVVGSVARAASSG